MAGGSVEGRKWITEKRSKGEHQVNQQSHSRSEQLFEKAQRYISGGVNSPSRSFAAVGGGSPVFIQRGEGAYLYSVDGHRYIDYLCAFGALILGHAHPEIVNAVSAGLRRGTVYGAPTELEVEFAAKLCEIIPTRDGAIQCFRYGSGDDGHSLASRYGALQDTQIRQLPWSQRPGACLAIPDRQL